MTSATVLGLVLGTGCSGPGAVSALRNPDGIVRAWPPPPAPARIHYVGQATSPLQLGARQSVMRRTLNLLTGSDKGREAWVRPLGLSADARGNVCLADPGAPAVGYFDRDKRRFYRWSTIADRSFSVPVAMIERDGLFYVADTGLGRVVVFGLDGELRFELGEPLVRPAGLVVFGELLVVADAAEHCLHVYTLQGRYIGRQGRRGVDAGQFNFPTHVAAMDDTLLVTDAMNFRVQVFDRTFTPVRSIGSAGQGSGQFSRPKGVTMDGEGKVYVVDALFDNVQVFNLEGAFLSHWGESGQGAGSFWMPGGIARDGDGIIYVADAYNKRIQLFRYEEPRE